MEGGWSVPLNCEPLIRKPICYAIKTFWRLAKVEDLIKGSDDKIRRAIIRVGSTGGKSSILRRPIPLLYPLEVHCIDKTETTNLNANQLPDTMTEVTKRHST